MADRRPLRVDLECRKGCQPLLRRFVTHRFECLPRSAKRPRLRVRGRSTCCLGPPTDGIPPLELI